MNQNPQVPEGNAEDQHRSADVKDVSKAQALIVEIDNQLKDKYVTTYEQSRKTNEKRELRPFDQFNEGGKQYVAIPSNWKEVCETNYLCMATNKALLVNHEKHQPFLIAESLKIELILSPDKEQYIQGLTLPITKGSIPEYRKDSRKFFSDGLSNAIHEIASCIKDYNQHAMKIEVVNKPIPFIMGTAWKTSKSAERKMLDYIIYTLRSMPVGVEIVHWLLRGEQLCNSVGLKTVHTSKIFSEDENTIIKSEYEHELTLRSIIHDINFPEMCQDLASDITQIIDNTGNSAYVRREWNKFVTQLQLAEQNKSATGSSSSTGNKPVLEIKESDTKLVSRPKKRTTALEQAAAPKLTEEEKPTPVDVEAPSNFFVRQVPEEELEQKSKTNYQTAKDKFVLGFIKELFNFTGTSIINENTHGADLMCVYFTFLKKSLQEFKTYKVKIETIIQSRLNTVYKHKLVGKRNKDKKLSELITIIYPTVEYYNGFNPLTISKVVVQAPAITPLPEEGDVKKYTEYFKNIQSAIPKEVSQTLKAYYQHWSGLWLGKYLS